MLFSQNSGINYQIEIIVETSYYMVVYPVIEKSIKNYVYEFAKKGTSCREI